eukprot:XP_001703960.1 Hypothetical protein GL50803_18891 [Giardia lamblia ATCC 50803]
MLLGVSWPRPEIKFGPAFCRLDFLRRRRRIHVQAPTRSACSSRRWTRSSATPSSTQRRSCRCGSSASRSSGRASERKVIRRRLELRTSRTSSERANQLHYRTAPPRENA